MGKSLIRPILLVISDNPSIRFWIKKHLDDQFYILEAHDRKEAIELVRQSSLDFIIIDSALETDPALEVCKELRKILLLTPILLITGRLKKSYRDQALDAGVTDFLSNHLDFEELETRIATEKKALSLREKTSGLFSTMQPPKKEFSKAYFQNKFLLHDQALRLLAAAKAEQKPIVILVLRIDQFDELQTQEGFFYASQILPLFSEMLQRHLRESDLLIPSSDGRFILLLPDISVDEGKKIAEHLRKVVQKERFETKKGPISLTVSIAFSSLEASEHAFNQMIEGAVKALKSQAAANLIISLDKEIL